MLFSVLRINIRGFMNKFFEHFYRNKNIILLLFSISVFFQWFAIPPFQSPDEFSHYVNAKSILNLSAPEVNVPVGDNERRYLWFFERFAFKYEQKLTKSDNDIVKDLKWDDSKTSQTFGNTASDYFPLVYLPASVGLGIGKLATTRINKTYEIARVFTAIFSIIILMYAFSLVQPNLFTILVLFTPMSIFQYVSISPDAISFSLIVLICSLIIKIKDEEFSKLHFWILTISILAFVGHRANFYFILLLPFAIYWKKDKLKYAFLFSIIIVGFILGWYIIRKLSLPSLQTNSGYSSSEIIMYYLSNPLKILEVLYNTLTNETYISSYWKSLIGILGWLDYSIGDKAIICLSLLLVVAFSIHIKVGKYCYLDVLASIVIITSIFMVFGALLILWSPFPNPTYIEGVQGRYFIPTLLALGYFFNMTVSKSKWVNIASSVILIMYIIITNYSMMSASLLRYYIG